MSVAACTVCAAGASCTWDIYSQIASRLKSVQALHSACLHVDRKARVNVLTVSGKRLGERISPTGRAVLFVEGGLHEQRIMGFNDLRPIDREINCLGSE